MKFKFLSVILALVLICGSLSVTASAEEYQSMDVSYHIDYGYTVNIPTSANLSKGKTCEITASDVFIGEGERLSVSLDIVMSHFVDNAITLTSNEGMALNCNIYKEDVSGENKSMLSTENTRIALFKPGETQAYSGGVLSLNPVLSNGFTSGDYTGKIHFIIDIISEYDLS